MVVVSSPDEGLSAESTSQPQYPNLTAYKSKWFPPQDYVSLGPFGQVGTIIQPFYIYRAELYAYPNEEYFYLGQLAIGADVHLPPPFFTAPSYWDADDEDDQAARERNTELFDLYYELSTCIGIQVNNDRTLLTQEQLIKILGQGRDYVTYGPIFTTQGPMTPIAHVLTAYLIYWRHPDKSVTCLNLYTQRPSTPFQDVLGELLHNQEEY